MLLELEMVSKHYSIWIQFLCSLWYMVYLDITKKASIFHVLIKPFTDSTIQWILVTNLDLVAFIALCCLPASKKWSIFGVNSYSSKVVIESQNPRFTIIMPVRCNGKNATNFFPHLIVFHTYFIRLASSSSLKTPFKCFLQHRTDPWINPLLIKIWSLTWGNVISHCTAFRII